MKILKAKIKKSLYGYKVFTYLENSIKKPNFSDCDFERDYLLESVHRAKRQAIDYGINNLWDYFITITFDREKIDRYNYDLCLQKVKKSFQKYRDRKAPNFKYIIIPELHTLKKGENKPAIHFHGLISGLRQTDLKYIKYSKKYQNSVYSFIPMFERFGAVDLYPITDQTENVTYYMCKYICKSGRVLKRSYYCSKGLETSKEILNSETNSKLIPNLNTLICNGFTPSYTSDFCNVYDIPPELLPFLDNRVNFVEDLPDCYLLEKTEILELDIWTQFPNAKK